jgi:two-component system chemotaxis sensor kinase CheA
MDTELNVDAGLRAEFIDESLDLLAGLEPLFIRLEEHPGDLDTVQAIFRPVHSIKGNSSFFNFPHVKALAHEMETLLDLVRKKTLAVSRAIIDALLEGSDVLRVLLDRGRADLPEVEDPAAFNALIERVKAAAHAGRGPADVQRAVADQLRAVKERFAASVPALAEALDRAIADLSPEEAAPAVPDAAPGVPAALTRLLELLAKPIDGMLPPAEAAAVAASLQALLPRAADDATRARVAEALDNYQTFVDTVGFDDLLREFILGAVPEGNYLADPAPEAGPGPGVAAAPEAPAAAAARREEPGKTMRVSEQHVDTFLAYVGELLVVGDMLHHLASRMGRDTDWRALQADFRRTLQTFDALSSELQRSIMSIRLVAVKGLLQRVPRIVRDVAAKTGKEIEVTIVGEEIEVDKSLVDLLDAPLTHMVRNAADHGIEPPGAREAAGKPRAGAVRVTLAESGPMLSLRIEDDGAGLNYDAIQKKAESLGLVPPGKRLTQDDVVQFLFCSGVSTAQEVTDVSGRGVGMDVVKGMVEEAGGNIQVHSEPGRGTRFEINVPMSVTTQIVPGFLIEAGGQRFVFPMAKVLETVRIDRAAIHSVADRGHCFQHHGRVLTLSSIRRVFEMEHADHDGRDFELVVTLETRQGPFAIAVDHVLGVQKVVLRRIQGLNCRSEAIAGGALMGDGSVALILDVDKLYRESLVA